MKSSWWYAREHSVSVKIGGLINLNLCHGISVVKVGISVIATERQHICGQAAYVGKLRVIGSQHVVLVNFVRISCLTFVDVYSPWPGLGNRTFDIVPYRWTNVCNNIQRQEYLVSTMTRTFIAYGPTCA